MRTKAERSWVIVRLSSGAVRVWRDYGIAWGSPVYTVLGFFTGTHVAARKHAKETTNARTR